jgi:splicing factor U2AF subunit
VQEEAARYGSVEQVAVPPPTPAVQDLMPGRCYVKYATSQDAEKGKAVFEGRTLDGNAIKASFVLEEEWQRAAAGEWVSKQSGVAGIPLPGLYGITPLVSGITGLSALNPSLAALVATNPGIASMMVAGINEDEVPFEEGYVKLRGLPPTTTKPDIQAFMQVGSRQQAAPPPPQPRALSG